MLTINELVKFEKDIKDLFENGEIKYPVHLSGGNEEDLIKIFNLVLEDDWVFSTHRSHLHALLKGVPPESVKEEILKGHSISLNFPEYKFFASGIVASAIPVAVGVALAGDRVWCFLGDMAAETGMFHECLKFSKDLPVRFVVENNGKSVNTPTEKVWKYSYENEYPHQGIGKYVVF